MHARMISAAAVAAAVAIVGAGCAGAGAETTGATLGGAAAVVPANAVAFVAVDTDASSAQWQAVDSLLGKFPAKDDLLAKLRAGFEQRTKLSWDGDVRPALGRELDLAVLPGAQPQAVGLLQPPDQAKLHALLAKLDPSLVSRQVGDWTAVASSTGALDAVAGASTTLADNNVYIAATAKLDGGALARAFANGSEARQLLDALPGQKQPQAPTSPAAGGLQWAAADVVAEGDGLRVRAFVHALPLSADQVRQSPLAGVRTAPYEARLVDEIPAGALAVLDVQFPPSAFELVGPQLPPALQTLLGGAQNATALESELDQIFGGETALYVRPGLPIPELTLVTSPSDTQAAVTALGSVLDTLRAAAPAGNGAFDLSKLPVYHAVIGGELVVSTLQQGISDFEGGGAKLASDGSFTEAQKASAMPARTTGFLYVNLKDTLPLVQTFAPLVGLKLPPALQQADLQALRTLTAFGSAQGDDSAYTVFVEVK